MHAYAGFMLCVRALGKTYRGPGIFSRERVRVLDDVTFEVPERRIVGLVGANGAGKTTILHVIAGLVRPDRGEVELDDSPLTPPRAHRAVALCSSADRSFYYRMTLRANLEFFGALQGLHGRALRERIDAALAATDLHGFADRRYSGCSTGVRQRLTFARALLCDARVVLLDEPTRAVDALHAQRLHRFIRGTLCSDLGKAIVLATNSLEEAWSVCDTIVLLSRGRVLAVDTPQALSERVSWRVLKLPEPEDLFDREYAG